MGFFKTNEEKEIIKKQKEFKKEKNSIYLCAPLQAIGQIPRNEHIMISLSPEKECMIFKYLKTKEEISLPYNRIINFKIENQVSLQKSDGTIKNALIGGFLFGETGAIIGSTKGKGNTSINWFATLNYKDKEGNEKELVFVEETIIGRYTKKNQDLNSIEFEKTVNKIISKYSEKITEL